MAPPRTAAIVTCYNQERFIRQALDSLVAQTVPPAEVVVIDGHSSDRSVAVIERWIAENEVPFELTFIRHDRNYGLCATLNQGMAAISSEFVLTLYGDDWLDARRIEIQAPILAETTDDVAMAIGNLREVDRRGVPLAEIDYSAKLAPLHEMSPVRRLASLITENVIASPAVLLKADHVRAVGGYDESLTFDDYDMWLRLLSVSTFVHHHDIVVNYRILGNSLSRSRERHGDFLLSEAKMVSKHRGIDSDIDARIARRLDATVAKLAEMDDAARLRAVARLQEQLGRTRGTSLVRALTRVPGGTGLIAALRKKNAA
ncbi:MAG: glycosyltransferase [Microbacterium sp.]